MDEDASRTRRLERIGELIREIAKSNPRLLTHERLNYVKSIRELIIYLLFEDDIPLMGNGRAIHYPKFEITLTRPDPESEDLFQVAGLLYNYHEPLSSYSRFSDSDMQEDFPALFASLLALERNDEVAWARARAAWDDLYASLRTNVPEIPTLKWAEIALEDEYVKCTVEEVGPLIGKHKDDVIEFLKDQNYSGQFPVMIRPGTRTTKFHPQWLAERRKEFEEKQKR